MNHQRVQKPQNGIPIISNILQRRNIPSNSEKAVQPTETENKTFRQSRFQHDFSKVPVNTPGQENIQRKGLHRLTTTPREMQLQRKLYEYALPGGAPTDRQTTDAIARLKTIASRDIDAHLETGHQLVSDLISNLDAKKITLNDVETEVKKFSKGTLPTNFRNQLLHRSLGTRHTVVATAGTVIEHYVNDKVPL
jgi:hypothetical protein